MTKSSLAFILYYYFFIGEITIFLPIVFLKNTLPTRGLSSICLKWPTSIKNMSKFVFFLAFYVSFLLKHKKLKKQEKKRSKN